MMNPSREAVEDHREADHRHCHSATVESPPSGEHR